jgi:SPP1 gp7 family putative phage head morphogenesis protein
MGSGGVWRPDNLVGLSFGTAPDRIVGPTEGRGMKAQARMANIWQSLRKALAVGDRRYFGECAEAVRRADEAHAALAVSYPLVGELEQAFEAGVAAAWHDANGRALEMLRRAGGRLVRPKAKVSTQRRGERGEGTQRTAGRQAAGPAVFGSGAGLEAEAIRLLLEGEDLVVPVEAVRRYAQGRVVPLRGTISEQRKALCRDIIARISEEGGGAREAMRALEDEGFGKSALQRENIARTEATTLYVHGSVARYSASSCVTGLQFSNPDDDRTTDECHDLNGMIFAVDDVDGVTPPLHFECRSELEPVLFDETPEEFDTAAGYLADPETENPMEGFGGLDLTGFPPARQPQDLYAPLAASEKAGLRELYQEIMAGMNG